MSGHAEAKLEEIEVKLGQDDAKTSQDGSKLGQDGPRCVQVGGKMRPRWTKSAKNGGVKTMSKKELKNRPAS